MSDLIDRQTAIEALNLIGSLDTEADREYAVEVFEMLPSAQPDIVRCKECKNSRGKIANRTKCGLHNWWVGFDYFCADGERMEEIDERPAEREDR